MELRNKVMLITCIILVGVLILSFYVGVRPKKTEHDKGWRITEDGDMEITKPGLAIDGCMFIVDTNNHIVWED